MNSLSVRTLSFLKPLHENVLHDLRKKKIYTMETLLSKKPTDIRDICFNNCDYLAWNIIIDVARSLDNHLSDDYTWTDLKHARRLSKAYLHTIIMQDKEYNRVIQILYSNGIKTLGDLIEVPPSIIPRIEQIARKRLDIIQHLLFWVGYYPDEETDSWQEVSPNSRITPEAMNKDAEMIREHSRIIYNALKQTGYLTKDTIERVEGLAS